MPLFRRPTESEIAATLEGGAQGFSYSEVGDTADQLGALEAIPKEYDVDHYRFLLGSGDELFRRAHESLFS